MNELFVTKLWLEDWLFYFATVLCFAPPFRSGTEGNMEYTRPSFGNVLHSTSENCKALLFSAHSE